MTLTDGIGRFGPITPRKYQDDPWLEMRSLRSLFSLLTDISITMPCSAFRQRIKSQEVKNIILAGPQTGSGAMSFVVTEHIAAISPYSKFQTQPTQPPGLDVKGAVYLFRHEIIHVNRTSSRTSGWTLWRKPPPLDRLHASGRGVISCSCARLIS